jgi:hypothetical protein
VYIGVHYGENSSPQNNLIKSRKLRPKDTEAYNDFDPFVGGNEPQNPERYLIEHSGLYIYIYMNMYIYPSLSMVI